MPGDENPLELHLKVLGRTLEHLGVQTYKRRDTAIAELVANCWDAGADRVETTVPDSSDYDRQASEIVSTVLRPARLGHRQASTVPGPRGRRTLSVRVVVPSVTT